jgi:hypothetical protein
MARDIHIAWACHARPFYALQAAIPETATPETALWLFQVWPPTEEAMHMAGGLGPSSTPLDTPRFTPLIHSLD